MAAAENQIGILGLFSGPTRTSVKWKQFDIGGNRTISDLHAYMAELHMTRLLDDYVPLHMQHVELESASR